MKKQRNNCNSASCTADCTTRRTITRTTGWFRSLTKKLKELMNKLVYKYKSRFVLVRLSNFVSVSYFLVPEESCRNSKTFPVTFLKSERKTRERIDHLGKSD